MSFLDLVCLTVASLRFVYWLLDFPVAWGFVLGFVIAAVTPAVVVPAMISCQVTPASQNDGIKNDNTYYYVLNV
jgi:NhaP-type Na+/H+ or K+/H+ antiporter